VVVQQHPGRLVTILGADEMWLRDHGFVVEVVEAEPGLFWADLRHVSNWVPVRHRYGQGRSPQEAIRSAREWFELELLPVKP